jgi:branched-chain amino acid transport system permease protein
MEVFLQQLINGLTLGSIYGLIAIGYTMVFGIIGMVNFAHGDIFMLSAFIALIFFMLIASWFGAGLIVVALIFVLILAMFFTSLWNWAIERVAYRPLRGSFRLAPLISAIGMSIFLSNFVQVVQGPRNKSIPPMLNKSITLIESATYSVQISYKQIVIIVTPPCCWRPSGTSSRRRRSAAPSAPASRTARWPRCSASTSTAPSRSPS